MHTQCDLPDKLLTNSLCRIHSTSANIYDYGNLGPVSRKSRELFGPEKPFVKLRPAFSVKLVFSYVVKGIQIKITAKFSASRRLRFEDTKRIMSPETRPKSFGTFEKQAPGRHNTTTVQLSMACLASIRVWSGVISKDKFNPPPKK